MDTHTRKRHINLEAGIEVLLPQAKEYKAPLEAGRCKGTISYSAFRDTLTLSSSWFHSYRPQNFQRAASIVFITVFADTAQHGSQHSDLQKQLSHISQELYH